MRGAVTMIPKKSMIAGLAELLYQNWLYDVLKAGENTVQTMKLFGGMSSTMM